MNGKKDTRKLAQRFNGICFTFLVLAFVTPGIIWASAKQELPKLTYRGENVTIKTVFDEIRKQTQLQAFYDQSGFNDQLRVTVDFNHTPIDTVLHTLLKELPYDYEIQHLSIRIRKKAVQQVPPDSNRSITGRVLDRQQSPVAGATIRLKQENAITQTDAHGFFKLNSVPEKGTLIISSMGYTTQELAVSGGQNLSVLLDAAINPLDETVVIAYGSSSRRNLTGSVGRVTAKDLATQPILNPLQGLSGRIPGVQVTEVSGVPGSNLNIQIRGQNSLRSDGNRPFYIIDGVPYIQTPISNNMTPYINSSVDPNRGISPLSYINVNDILSIEVLKDADATAIYGSRGANGVILITTKKGQVGDSKVTFEVSAGQSSISKFMDLLDSRQYLEMRHEALRNDNRPIAATDYDLNGAWDTTRYTDWQKKLLGNSAGFTNADLNISGGNNLVKYLLSGGYQRQGTVFPGDNHLQRASAMLNLDANSKDRKWNYQVTVNYSNTNTDLPGQDLTNTAIRLPPVAPALYDETGKLNWQSGTWTNPLQSIFQPYNNHTNSLLANGSVTYQLFSSLSLKNSVGYVNAQTDEKTKFYKSSYNPDYVQQYPASYPLRTNFGTGKNTSWIVEPQLNYQKHVGKANISFLLGSTFQQEETENTRINAQGFSNEALMENLAAADQTKTTSTYAYSLYKYNALFGRASLNYAKQYLLNLTARRDGSSRFGPGYQFGNFYSVGAAWNFTEMKYLKENLVWLSYGKLRASYGTTGSDQIGNYGYLDSYTTSGGGQYQNMTGLIPARLYNNTYHWEKNKKLDVAIDLGFLKDRLLTSLTYFRNRSGDQLVGYTLPPSTGFTSIQANLNAAVQNTGVEIDISTTNIQIKNFKWTTNFNISFLRNKLASFPNLETSAYASSYIIDESVYIFKQYQSTGVDPNTGLYTILDVDNNKVFNVNDRIYISDFSPKFYGGLNNHVEFKKFYIDALFQFSKQNGYSYLNAFPIPGLLINQPIYVLDRWRETGNQTSIQKYSISSAASTSYSNQKGSNAFEEDASFIRLKNIAISYQINLQNHIPIKCSLAAQNLFTITKYKGFDPENNRYTGLPPLRTYTIGIQVTL